MNQRLIDLYLEFVNDYLTTDKWSEDMGIDKDRGKKLLHILYHEYTTFTDK